jgi:hypothetical protein
VWAQTQWGARAMLEEDRRQQGIDTFSLRARGVKDRRGLRLPEFGPTS